jgi:beta-N-acetylhexosaminidase
MRRVAVVIVALAVAGCTSSGARPSTSTSAGSGPPATSPAPSSSAPSTSASSSVSSSASRSTSTAPSASPAQSVLARMSLRQRVGQLLMVDCPTSGVTAATESAVTGSDVGSVILDGTTFAGATEIAAITRQLQGLAPKGVGLFVATDQEGGEVQRLQGPGFTRIVSGVRQGAIDPARLQRYAQGWGTELRQAGVNVNLAPVLDVVPAGFGTNPPIGDLDRQYGSTPSAVTAHGLAVARGLSAAGIVPTVKHFPGLGRVHGNTDLTAGVTDTVTTPDDPYLAPFRAAVRAGVPFVMMSTAVYAHLDPGTPAAFSSRIVTGLLRGSLGFRGVVVSDDLGGAAQVADLSPGERAVSFVAAGGDLVLTVDAGQAGEMTSALVARARSDPGFRRKVDAAALRVLRAKQRQGLLG